MDEVANFDSPLFKRLAHNDTGTAVGHQGGIVIPRDLDKYFPQLSGQTSVATPTVDTHIRAALFVGTHQVDLVTTRYQYQTWGGERSPERRLTGNLGALRDSAKADDYLIIERSIVDPAFYRITLLRSGTPDYQRVRSQIGNRRWGALDIRAVPVSETEIIKAATDQAAREAQKFEIFDSLAPFTEARVKRLARSRAFQQRVTSLYDYRCVLCGQAHVTVGGITETEAAHIVPRGLRGADDARNGLALCRGHHWAFDHGLFGVENRVVSLCQNKSRLTHAISGLVHSLVSRYGSRLIYRRPPHPKPSLGIC